MNKKDKKNGLILLLAVVLMFMSVCYSILFQKLTILGSVKVEPQWKIKVTEVTFKEYNNGVNENVEFTGNAISISALLEKPGDYVDYIIKVENKGNMDAMLSDVLNTIEESKYIKFDFKALDEAGNDLESFDNLKLKSGEYQYFRCRIYFDNDSNDIIETDETAKNVIVLNYIQDLSK